MEMLLHSLGFCGETHVSFIALLIEHANMGTIINYFKTLNV